MSLHTITRTTAAAALAALTLAASFDAADARGRSVPDATDRLAIDLDRDRVAGADIIGEMTIDPPPPDPGISVGNLAAGVQQGGGGPFQAAEDWKAGYGCAVSCITGGVAYQHGPDARLKVTTNTPAEIWIIVWDDFGYHRMESSPHDDVTEFEFVFDDVDLDSSYYALAVAEDSEGHADHADGEFTTGQRHVEIDFGAVNPTLLPAGAHDLQSAAYVNGVSESVGALPVGTTRHDVGRYLDLVGQASVDVPPVGNEICEAFGLHYDLSHYVDGACYFVASVFGEDIDLDDRPANAGAAPHTIETTLVHPGGQALPPGYGQQFQFNVPVELTVWYG